MTGTVFCGLRKSACDGGDRKGGKHRAPLCVEVVPTTKLQAPLEYTLPAPSNASSNFIPSKLGRRQLCISRARRCAYAIVFTCGDWRPRFYNTHGCIESAVSGSEFPKRNSLMETCFAYYFDMPNPLELAGAREVQDYTPRNA